MGMRGLALPLSLTGVAAAHRGKLDTELARIIQSSDEVGCSL